MRGRTIDGIPVFVADGPPPLAAGLVFGVGRRDETFVRGGITHLVEHLAMGALGRTTVDANASVDLAVTEFTATGAPDRVAEVLRAVCAALADLPTDRLAVDADVLRSEGGLAAAPRRLRPARRALRGDRTGIGVDARAGAALAHRG